MKISRKNKATRAAIRLSVPLLIAFLVLAASVLIMFSSPVLTMEKRTNGNLTFIDGAGSLVSSTIEISMTGAPSGRRSNANSISWRNAPNAWIYFDSHETNDVSINLQMSGDSHESRVSLENYSTYLPGSVNISAPGTSVKYVEINTTGEIYSGISNYLDASRNLTVLVMENDYTRHGNMTYSRIMTDYIDGGINYAATNLTVQGDVRDKDNNPLSINITAYGANGNVLYSTASTNFNWMDIPGGGNLQFDALSTKDVSAKFKLNANSTNSAVILDRYSSNPEAENPEGIPIKYVNVSASNLNYSSVEIKIRYNDADLGSQDESLLAIYHYKNGSWNRLSTTVDALNNTVTATVTSLSSFAVIEATTRYNATLYVYDTKGNTYPADDKLVNTAGLSNLPANGTTFDLGFIGDIYKNHTYVIELQIRPNYDYEFDADYRKETFFQADNSFSLTDTSRQEYLVNTTLVTDDKYRTEDIFISQIHQVNYSVDYEAGEYGIVRGDLDVISGSDDTIVRWHNNTAGDGSSWGTGTVYDDTDFIQSVAVGDIDNDGDLDVVSGNYNGSDIRLHRNNGDGTWTTTDVYLNIGDTVYALALGDIDGDGDLDVIAGKGSAGGYKVGWYNNTGDFASAWPRIEVTTLNYAYYSVALGDIDGDGDIDIIAGNSGDDVYWYNNTAGDGSAWTDNLVDDTGADVYSVAVGDIDADGDLDIISGNYDGSDVNLHKNNGTGSTWTTSFIYENMPENVRSVAVGDIDVDGDLDVVSGIQSTGGDDVFWHKNTAGDGSTWIRIGIADATATVYSVGVGDIDSDGDLDIVSVDSTNNVLFHKNTAGDGSTWAPIVIATPSDDVYTVAVGDLDNDASSNILDYYYNDTEGAEHGADEFYGWDNLTADEDYFFYFIASVDDDWSDGTNDTITFYCGNEAGSGWALTEPKMYGAVRTPIKVNWTWNITTAPPVTLEVNISQAPTGVTRGEVFSSLNSSVNNTGTVNATSTWLNWTLPSGWSNQTGNLDQSPGILEPDEVGWNNLTVNVSQSAALGPQTVTAGADCDEAAWESDSKSITVYAPTNISQVTSNRTNPVQTDIILLSARLLWDNGTAISGQNISFNNDSIYIGSDFTNSTGWAQVSWNTTGAGLLETINATYDGNATIYSRASHNNSLAITFPDMIMTVYTNLSEYRRPANILINGNVTNITGGGPSVGAAVNISVFYPNGTQAYYNQTTTDSYGGYNTTYDIAASDPIGTYTVNTNATSTSGNFTTNSTTFLVVVGLVVDVNSDKTAYIAGGNVSIIVYAEYNNGTKANNSLVNLTIKDPDGTIINETSGYINAAGYFFYLYTLPANAIEGTYSVTAKVIDPENYVEYAYTSFDVIRKAATLTVDPSVTIMWQNQSKIFFLEVTNTGVENITGSVNLTITDPLYFNITNITAKEFTNLTSGSQFTAEFNVTVNTTTPLATYKLNATLSFDTDPSQKDVYIKVIKEPELFVRAVTDKATYLMDPYYWVYYSDISDWTGGHPRNVTINAMVVDQYGRLLPNERYTAEPIVRYEVINGTGVTIYRGNLNKTRTGFYSITFQINETNLGQANYSVLPCTFAVYVNVSGLGKEISGSNSIKVDRWGCDYYNGGAKCHYPPTMGSHANDWPFILGGGDNPFNISYLTDPNLTHSPDDTSLFGTTSDPDYTHEHSISRGSGSCNVAGCHNFEIECKYCHRSTLQGEHTKVDVPGVDGDHNCANTSCHGRLNTTTTKSIDNAYPNCSASPCHPISYRDNFTITSWNESIAAVPQWLNTTTGTPGDIAVHPNPGNAIVNCSFCHNSFHNLYDENNVLTCGDCHNESTGYKLHNGTTAPSPTSANCTECHNNTPNKIDIHNTTTPRCTKSGCHDGIVAFGHGYNNHSSYNVSCLQCHNDRKLNYSGSVLTDGTYMMNTSLHSQDNLIPGCTECHIGYSNHSSYNTYGIYCAYCHDNRSLSYIGLKLYNNDSGQYNTTYHTSVIIHTLNRSEMFPSCSACHGSPQYKYHLGNQTDVSLGIAVNCTQCHDNQTLNYTGTILPVQGNYSTGSDIHTTNRTLMLPNQTLVYNNNCGKCHYLVYGSMEHVQHSRGSNCSVCHYGYYMEYKGIFQYKPVEHSENITRLSCTGCHFNWTRMNSSINKPLYYVNGTMFNASAHGTKPGTNCTLCHTKYHPPPRYSWKACECCHAVQTYPVTDRDRHNITAASSTYSVGGDNVTGITDCTVCHDSALYNRSITTYSYWKQKDCDYCHTYPDKYYE